MRNGQKTLLSRHYGRPCTGDFYCGSVILNNARRILPASPLWVMIRECGPAACNSQPGRAWDSNLHRDCDVVQPPAAAPDPDRVCAAMASSSSGVFRERRHIGARHMANPGTTNAPLWVVGRSRFVNRMGRRHPAPRSRWMSSRSAQIHADSRYRIHTHCSSPQRGHV
jgi:hypothetical protein